MIKKCSKCGDNYHTATFSDSLCCHCDGSTPRLTYYEYEDILREIEKEEKEK